MSRSARAKSIVVITLAVGVMLAISQWSIGTITVLRELPLYDDTRACQGGRPVDPALDLSAQHVIAVVPAGVTLHVHGEDIKSVMCLEVVYQGDRGWLLFDPRSVEYSQYPPRSPPP